MDYRHIFHIRGTVTFWEWYGGIVVIDHAVEHFIFAADFDAVYDETQEQALCVQVSGGEGVGEVDGGVGEHVRGDFRDGLDGGGVEIGELAFEIGFVHLQFFETFGGRLGLFAEFFEDLHQVGDLLSDGGKPRNDCSIFISSIILPVKLVCHAHLTKYQDGSILRVTCKLQINCK